MQVNDRFKRVGSGPSVPQLYAASLTLLIASGAHAAWVTDGQLRIDTRYDDNVTLSSTDEQGSSVTTAKGELEVRQVTENSDVSLVGGVNYVSYGESQAGTTELNDKDVEYMDLRSSYETERTTFGLRGTARRDVTLATVDFIRDPIATGVGDSGGTGATSGGSTGAPGGTPGTPTGTGGTPTGTDSAGNPLTGGTLDGGSVEQQVRRYNISVDPYIEYLLSERTTLQVDYVYSSSQL